MYINLFLSNCIQNRLKKHKFALTMHIKVTYNVDE